MKQSQSRNGLFRVVRRAQVVVARLQRLPRLEGFPTAAVPRSPYPNDSDFYNTIRRAAPHQAPPSL